MKIQRGAVIGISVIVFIILLMVILSAYERNKSRTEFAQRIISQGNQSDDNINSLKRSIAAYERRIEKHVQDAAQTGVYWKLLAVRLQDRDLHGEALEALERAIFYLPEDAQVHYYTGVSAGIMAKSIHLFPGRDNSERIRYYNLAEDAFLRAIELDAHYLRPRYSLGVLYVFDVDRPEEAVPYLQQALEISRNDVDTMFVLARAYYMLRRYREAVELYDRIISIPTDPQKKIDAQNNRQMVMGLLYG